MKRNIVIVFLLLIVFSCYWFYVLNNDLSNKEADINCQSGSLNGALQDLGICLNVDEQQWTDSVNTNSEIAGIWRYFCDTTYFTIYKMSHDISCERLFLLEVKINHGSGEYDNYIIKREELGYKIISEFKGYLKEIIDSDTGYFKLTYQFNIAPDCKCLVIGRFDNHRIRTDTVLSTNEVICKENFIQGQPW